jgi:predicted alpha/beta superfamily hydrolase
MIPVKYDGGELLRYENFPSRFITPRHVDIWLPPGYKSSHARYRVLYIHDGQNLFDPSTAFGGVDWGMDEAIVRMMEAGEIPGLIVVGIWNCGEKRWREYMPQKAAESASALMEAFIKVAGGEPWSDNYLRFIVEEVKPFVDSNFRTLTGQADTFVMGSSMGGLISLYALEQYPQVFGGAGCMSTHWPAGKARLVDYLGKHLPAPGQYKLYFDFGTTTLDAQYERYQVRMDAHLRAAGYRSGVDWMTHKFEGAAHNEASWRERVHIPLKFLLS